MLNFYSKAARRISSFLLIFFTVSFNYLAAQVPVISLSPVISSGLNQPIQLVNAGDGTNRIFIVQKEGTIRVYDQSYNFLANFLTVTNVSTDGERGLLSMTFHPAYTTNGFFYVYYTNTNGDLELARYHISANANVADAASKVIVLTIPHPGQSNHNGGELHFGTDGFLYLSTGDGGGGGDPNNNAQNTAVRLGKILRLAVNTSAVAPFYSAAPGNPFANDVYAYGLRNPFRWSFDKQTQDMWIGDVGQNSWEEINFRAAASTAGTNYGWRCYEGDVEFNTTGCGNIANYVFPVHVYPNPAQGSTAVTGGTVYRGANLALQGWYVAADFYTGNFYKIAPNGGGGWTKLVQMALQGGVADFGETENGELYAVSLTSGTVYQLLATDGGPLPVTLVSLAARNSNGSVILDWKTSMEQDLRYFGIEYSINRNDFKQVATISAQNAAAGASYSFNHSTSFRDRIYYRLKMIGKDGSFQYSPIISIDPVRTGKNFVYPSAIGTTRKLIVSLIEPFDIVEVVTLDGKILVSEKIQGRTGTFDLLVPGLPAGMYLVRLKTTEKMQTQKIVIQH